MNYDLIKNKHKELIDIAIKYMDSINDYEHDINHMNDVCYYTELLCNRLNIDINYEVCIIGAYWHDVGRIKLDMGHEKLSAEMLKNTMKKMNYDNEFILKCYESIVNHKWNMMPKTNEGLIVRDADKLAWLGIGRWKSCIGNKVKLDELVGLLPRLRNELLYFDESKKIYDEVVINLIKYLYDIII